MHIVHMRMEPNITTQIIFYLISFIIRPHDHAKSNWASANIDWWEQGNTEISICQQHYILILELIGSVYIHKY